MYKVRNPYKGSIMELNMMGVSEYRKAKLSLAEISVFAAPIFTIAVVALASAMPEIGFLAQCQNIPGGDVCSISIK